MALTFVEPSTMTDTANILLYGPPGTGKSVAACSAPGPILLLNAEGPEGPRYGRRTVGTDKIHEVEFTGSNVLNEVFFHLRDGGAEQTVVVDTVGEVHRMLLAECGGERPTLQQHGDVNLKVERFVRSLRDLPINVVLVAHELLDDQDGERVRRPDTGGRRLPEVVMAMMSIVSYTGVIPASEGQPARWVGQLVDGSGRRCKDRSGSLGQVRDLNLTEWIATANAGWAATTDNIKEIA